MKKKLFNLLIIIICFIFLIELFINKSLVYTSIMYSLNIWVNNLIPAMMPFFIISDILINYNIINYIPEIFRSFFKKIFNITDNMVEIFILSMLSGFPTNAKNTRLLYDKGKISLEEANHILMFANFPNPIFVITSVGLAFLGSEKIGWIILISIYLSNIIVGLLIRRCFKHDNLGNNASDNMNIFFGNVFINAIKKAIDMVLLICGIVSTFMIISTIVVDMLNLNIYNATIIKGIFEFTIGIDAISKLNIPIIYKSLISCAFISFGGLSIHMQVFSQIVDTNIKYKYFFMGRIIQMILAIIINYILLVIFCIH